MMPGSVPRDQAQRVADVPCFTLFTVCLFDLILLGSFLRRRRCDRISRRERRGRQVRGATVYTKRDTRGGTTEARTGDRLSPHLDSENFERIERSLVRFHHVVQQQQKNQQRPCRQVDAEPERCEAVQRRRVGKAPGFRVCAAGFVRGSRTLPVAECDRGCTPGCRHAGTHVGAHARGR